VSNEYRCTRPNCYPPRSPGHTDKSARQGHYIDAENEESARRAMRWLYPNDTHFDVELWKLGSAKERAL